MCINIKEYSIYKINISYQFFSFVYAERVLPDMNDG